MPSVVLTSAYDELNNYLVAHKTNTNVVRGLVDRVVTEAAAGWAVSAVVVEALTDLPYDEPMDVQMSATVWGTGEFSQNVTWSISGNVSESTVIDANGVLSLALGEFEDENQDPVVKHNIIVTATSADNGAISGTYPVVCTTTSLSMTYDANGGSETQTDASSPYTYDDTVTVATETTFVAPTGKVFERWAWAANGTGAVVPATFAIQDNMVLYAIWKNIYTVTYNANGGAGEMTDRNSPYEEDAEVVVAANTFIPPTDATFVKWNTAANGSGTDYDPAETFAIDANTTLYAIWQYAIVKQTLVAGTQLYIEAFTSGNETFISDLSPDTSITLTFTEWKLGVGAVAQGTTFDLEVAYPVVAGLYLINGPLTTGDSFLVSLPVKFSNLTFTVRNMSSLVFENVMNIGFFAISGGQP